MKKIIFFSVITLCANVSFSQNTWDATNGTATTNGNISTTNGNLLVAKGGVGIGQSISSFKLGVYSINNVFPSGIDNLIEVGSSATQFGLRSRLISTGNGAKYGIYNSLSSNSTSMSYGIYNSSTPISSATGYGLHNYLDGSGSGSRIGIYSNVAGTGTGTATGIYAEVTCTTASVRIGLSSYVNNTGSNNSSTNATAFGLYSIGTGANSRAGYFKGDVEIANGNTIYAAANGSKTLFMANGGTDDYAFTIVPNQTNNAYDWDWTKTFVLKRDGEMQKTVSSDGRAFTITRAGATDVFKVYGNGKVYATEVNVMLGTNFPFPDYVFQPSYKLMPLKDVQSYINLNGHLPNVPSAAVVAEEGINLGDMTRILVEKVEELTLYMIEQQKIQELQKAEIELLKQQLSSAKH